MTDDLDNGTDRPLDLKALEDLPEARFVERVRRTIFRRQLASQIAEVPYHGWTKVLVEYVCTLFEALGFQRTDPKG